MTDKHEIAFVKFPAAWDDDRDVYIRAELIVNIFPWTEENYRVELTNDNIFQPVSAESVAAMKLVVLSQGEAVEMTIVASDDNIEQTILEAITHALEA